jgi:SanA protein
MKKCRRRKKQINILLGFLFIIIGIILFTDMWVKSKYIARIYDGNYNVIVSGKYKAAVIFGAGIYDNETPMPVLRDRVLVGVNLYKEGKVDKLLMSGDNRYVGYNEPQAMTTLAVENGVPNQDIIQDYAGRRTYDTCYRAKHIFQLDKAVLVTQSFHLPRSLYICNGLGLKSVGVTADLDNYLGYRNWLIREHIARIFTFFEMIFPHEAAVMGDPEEV